MFDDQFGLTQAVLEGRKTMTRRIIPPIEIDWNRRGKVTLPISGFKDGRLFMDTSSILDDLSEYIAPAKYQPKYDIGEVVAVAERYENVISYLASFITPHSHDYLRETKGWKNKMYVRADLMPHRIRFMGTSMERLQDISNEDCFREGITKSVGYKGRVRFTYPGDEWGFDTPREAFADLFNKISGKVKWEDNPWVYVYSFKRAR